MYVIEQPIPPTPAANSAANVLVEWNAVYDAYNEVACLMLESMTPEIHKQYKNYSPYGMLQELKSMFEKQARVERFDLIQTFHACKEEEGKPVAAYVLKMKGYVEQLECLGYVLPQDLSVGLILNDPQVKCSKMTRKPFLHRTKRATDLLEIICTDVCGPLRHVSRQAHGNYKPTIKDKDGKDVVTPYEKLDENQKKMLSKNDEAKMVLYNALPKKEYERIFIFNTIITSLKALDESFSSRNHVRKFLRALPSKWRPKVMAIEESKDLSKLSLDDLLATSKSIRFVDVKHEETEVDIVGSVYVFGDGSVNVSAHRRVIVTVFCGSLVNTVASQFVLLVLSDIAIEFHRRPLLDEEKGEEDYRKILHLKLQEKLWLNDEVRTRLCLFLSSSIGKIMSKTIQHKSLALKAKQVFSDDDTSSSNSNDEEYAMAVSKSHKVLGIAQVAIIDRQLPIEYTITSRSTNVMVPIPPAPASDSAANVLVEWNAVYDAYNEVACLMLKKEEGKPVAAYVLKMKGYVEQLECLGYVLPQDLSVGLILNGLTSDFVGFVRNYNIHNMRKTIGELHAMLIEYEKSKGKSKANGKGKDKQVYIPKPKNPKPYAKVHPAKDNTCHHCKEVGHWKRNCLIYLAELLKKKKQVGTTSSSGLRGARKLKQGALYLYVGNGVRAQVEAIGSFDLILPNGLYFMDYEISVSKNVLFFNVIPHDGIYEIDMHNLVPNVNSIYNVSNKIAKHNLDSTYLWRCRLAYISKMTRKPFPHRTKRATDLLGIIRTDVCGPLRHVSRQAHGNYKPTIKDKDGKDVVTPYEKLDENQKKMLSKNDEAKMVLYNALPKKEYERIFMCDTAQNIWDSLITTHQGNKQVKDNKIDLFVQKYEEFSITDDETIDCAFSRFNTIITSLKALDESFSSRNHVRKFLRALPSKWRPKVTTIEESKDLSKVSLDELVGNLKVYKVVLEKDLEIAKNKKEKYKLLGFLI
ncbi:retrotransposon protein, putative, ty1-copia subclass [Tanacetum coccineum]